MRTVISTLRTALADSWANRASFMLQVIFMMLNDGTWIVFWALFFNRVGAANGWTFADLVVMFSLLTVCSGIALGVFGNCRRIGRLAADGSLDETLVLPVAPLRYLLTCRVEATHLGDILFGLLLFALAGQPTPGRSAAFVFAVLTGVVVLVGFLVLCGSLTMFGSGGGDEADLGFNAILLLAAYPLDFFAGAVKVLLFTLVPAAFVSGVPVRLIRAFDLGTAVELAGAAAVTATLALVMFTLGLRRYSSGSLWQR